MEGLGLSPAHLVSYPEWVTFERDGGWESGDFQWVSDVVVEYISVVLISRGLDGAVRRVIGGWLVGLATHPGSMVGARDEDSIMNGESWAM